MYWCLIVPPGTASGPAVTRDNKLTEQKQKDCEHTVEQVFTLLESKLHTREIMTKKVSFVTYNNAIVYDTKGSFVAYNNAKVYDTKGSFVAYNNANVYDTKGSFVAYNNAKVYDTKGSFVAYNNAIVYDIIVSTCY